MPCRLTWTRSWTDRLRESSYWILVLNPQILDLDDIRIIMETMKKMRDIIGYKGGDSILAPGTFHEHAIVRCKFPACFPIHLCQLLRHNFRQPVTRFQES